MFRLSLRRLGRPASAIKTSSIIPQTRLLTQITARTSLSTLQSHIASREINAGFRFYSTESAVAAEDASANAVTSDPVESFKDLHKLGVHRTLTDSIVHDMGFDLMTPVQAKTINPALKGTDM